MQSRSAVLFWTVSSPVSLPALLFAAAFPLIRKVIDPAGFPWLIAVIHRSCESPLAVSGGACVKTSQADPGIACCAAARQTLQMCAYSWTSGPNAGTGAALIGDPFLLILASDTDQSNEPPAGAHAASLQPETSADRLPEAWQEC